MNDSVAGLLEELVELSAELEEATANDEALRVVSLLATRQPAIDRLLELAERGHPVPQGSLRSLLERDQGLRRTLSGLRERLGEQLTTIARVRTAARSYGGGLQRAPGAVVNVEA